jgi:glycosyltransferase involved in cell wall biosynthesis
MNPGPKLAELPPHRRLKSLFQLHKAEDYAAIAKLGVAHIRTAPIQEALIVANAFLRLDDCEEALEALRRRRIADGFAERHINLLVSMARRTHNWRALIEASKLALRRNPARADLVGYITTALRRLRRTREVERLCAHVEWRYRRGHLPLGLYIDMLRAMRTRKRVLAVEGDIGPATAPEVKVAFIEALVELADLDRAASRMALWDIASHKLSAPNRRTMDYFALRKAAFGVETHAELLAAILGSLDRVAVTPAAAPVAEAPRRILITTSSLGIGGAERQLSYLVDYLARLEGAAEVVVYGQTKQGPNITGYDLACPVVYKAQSEAQVQGPELARLYPTVLDKDLDFAFGFNTRDIAGLIARFRPDVIYSALGLPTEAVLAARLMKVGSTLVRFGGESFYNNFDGSDENEQRIRAAEFCCRTAPESVRFVTNSHRGRTVWAQRLEIAEGRIEVIPNGVPVPPEPVDARRRPAAEAAGFPPDAFVVGWVGRFHQVKRPRVWLDIALQLARRHPRMRFLMVGEGALRPAIEATVARRGLGDRFAFTGLVTGDLSPCYRSMDLLLQASETESFPNVVVEALSHGVAVVARAVGDVPRILADERLGTAVAVDSVDAYVEAVERRLGRGGDEEAERAHRRRHVIDAYGLEAMGRAYARRLGVGDLSDAKET